MLSFATVSFSECSTAISSSTGATILHGPHHSAQKSTSTGLSDAKTSVWNDESVTVFVEAPTGAPLLSAVLGGGGVCCGMAGASAPRVTLGRRRILPAAIT